MFFEEIKVLVMGWVKVVGGVCVVWFLCDVVLLICVGFLGNLVGYCVVKMVVEVVVVLLLVF